VQELAGWGFAAAPRPPDSFAEPLNASSLALDAYEAGRPSESEACRIGDARLLEGARRRRDGES